MDDPAVLGGLWMDGDVFRRYLAERLSQSVNGLLDDRMNLQVDFNQEGEKGEGRREIDEIEQEGKKSRK